VNAEVEVVREHRQTFLVMGARSLEDAERVALTWADKRKKLNSRVPKRWSRNPEHYVTWSQPVQVRNGEIVKEET
jgi:hypothetical protein